MMVFSQYGNFFIVLLFTLCLIPAVLACLAGRRIKYVGMLLNVVMLIFFLGLKTLQMAQFLVFLVCEIILIEFFLQVYPKWKNKWLYYGVLLLSMLPIFLVKFCVYTRFNGLGFLGISYISFRIWQIIIEIKDGHIKELNLLDALYFISFFPTLSSGPIDRYQRFLDDLNHVIPRKEYLHSYAAAGLGKILRGMVYKFGFAFLIQHFIMDQLPAEHTVFSTILYMYAYTFYLFFDFAGYSNFAVGTSYLVGIKVGENFNKPFLAKNMKEFWERWHISLSQWFGDYIFKRFVLNTMRKKIFKSRKTAARAGNMVTMLVMGIWHGPYLFYILYGLYEGLALVVTDIYLKSKFYKNLKKGPCFEWVSRFVCFHVLAFGMLLFSGYLLSI